MGARDRSHPDGSMAIAVSGSPMYSHARRTRRKEAEVESIPARSVVLRPIPPLT